MLKDAGEVPRWIAQGKVVRAAVDKLQDCVDQGREVRPGQAEEANAAIRLFNKMCPPQMQKPLWNTAEAQKRRDRSGG